MEQLPGGPKEAAATGALVASGSIAGGDENPQEVHARCHPASRLLPGDLQTGKLA